MNAIPKKIRFGQFFGIIVFLVVIIFSGLATGIQIYRDFKEAKVAREDSQVIVSKLAVQSLRAPLIQGSFIEAKMRARSILESTQVACLEIHAKDLPVAECELATDKKQKLYVITDGVFYDESQKEEAAKVTLYFDNSDIYASLNQKITFAAVTNSALALFVLGILLFASRIIKRDLNTIIEECEGKAPEGAPIWLAEFSYLKKKIKMHMDAAEVNAETRASGELARQVKHDIRSPLAALNNTIKSMVLPSDKKAVIQSAIGRINEIADDLNRTKVNTDVGEFESSLQSRQSISDILTSVIEEKRIQYKDLPEISFELHLDSDPDGSIVMDSKELKRILSNVLNNSVEAIEVAGLVKVEVGGDQDFARIFIVDTGKGIPPDVIPSLGGKGQTFGKHHGSGLGLHHAISTIESVGGRFTIDSDGISGTCVEILIPLATNEKVSSVLRTPGDSAQLAHQAQC
ncbi:MAG: HAMP domain-containing histidine kinase [Bdellovibrionaceae bacterium]|nr:HAMP domain-containing histidine kinase [Pseudobdellovibrionaceae bacterium]